MILWGWLSRNGWGDIFWEQHGTFRTRGKVAHCAYPEAATKSLRICFFLLPNCFCLDFYDWLRATREAEYPANLWRSYAFSSLNSSGSPQVLLQSLIIFWLLFGHRDPCIETSAFVMQIIITVGIMKYIHSGKEPYLLRLKKIYF